MIRSIRHFQRLLSVFDVLLEHLVASISLVLRKSFSLRTPCIFQQVHTRHKRYTVVVSSEPSRFLSRHVRFQRSLKL